MASGNSGRGHSNGGGAERGAQDRGVREASQEMGNRLRENSSAAREEVSRGYRDAESLVTAYPAPSVLVAAGIGFGVGLVLTSMLSTPKPSWAERHFGDTLSHSQESLHHLGEKLRDLSTSLSRRLSEQTGLRV